MIASMLAGGENVSAIIDEGTGPCTYGRLRELVGTVANKLHQLPPRVAVMSFLPNGLGWVVQYLAALSDRRAHIVADPVFRDRAGLIEKYQPQLIALAAGDCSPIGYELWQSLEGCAISWHVRRKTVSDSPAVHPDLALLLTTSGSTGSPKLVRLSYANIEANARSIIEYLGIGDRDVGIQSLPLHYSYGLSLLNTHLFAGATVAIPGSSFLRPEFWSFVRHVKGSSFAGIPYMYETLHRLRINPFDCESIHTVTQAGGALSPALTRTLNSNAVAAARRFFVMYGQTEATARMSYVPADRLHDKIGSIGIPIPRGGLSLHADTETGLSELVYSGPNVMMGYAHASVDLALPDQLDGVLRTGDIGVVDCDGYFRVTGRLARFAKLFGRRVNLSDVEVEAGRLFQSALAAIEGENSLVLFVEGEPTADMGQARLSLAASLGIPPSAVRIGIVDAIPRTSAGKTDYARLQEQ